LLLGFALAGLPSSAELDSDGPIPVVDSLHAGLLDVMRSADELGYEGRFERLTPILDECFDMPFMAQKSAGRYWRKMDEAEREKLRSSFRRFMIANYAGRFHGYSGQSFETLDEQPSTHGTVLILSRLLDPGAEPTQLDYRLHAVDGSWKIFDVYLKGTVSELALRRSEYSSLIQRDGLDALLAALDEKVAELAAGNAPAEMP
jgi:phospholipid transport system substrate-binding protein